MPNYYVNRRPQENGDHEVHAEKCEYLPSDRVYLGHFASCEDATLRAREQFRQVNGCKLCSLACYME